MQLKIGFLGIQHPHTQAYLKMITHSPHLKISGFWERNTEQQEMFQKENNIRSFDAQEELLAHSDAILVTSENCYHFEDSLAALKHGKHVLCENPIALNPENCTALVTLAEKLELVLMSALPYSYSPAFQELLKQCHSGEIGKVLAITAACQTKRPLGWLLDRKFSGGGALIDHTSYAIDLIYRILGEEPSKIQAQVNQSLYEEIEEIAMLSLEYPSGIFATIDSSWSLYQQYKTPAKMKLNVIGETGTLGVHLFHQHLEVYSAEHSPTYQLQTYGSNLYGAMLEDFIHAITSKKKPRASGLDGLRATKALFLAQDSLKNLDYA